TIAAYLRLVYLCDDLPNTHSDVAVAHVETLRTMAELLNSDEAGIFDRSLFDDGIDRCVDANPLPEILGAVLAICVQSGRRDAKDIRDALNGQFAGSVQHEEERIGALRGILLAAPQLLWRSPDVLEVIDEFLGAMSEEAFLALLPHMRLAFAALNPR